jgi:hypothetical protein
LPGHPPLGEIEFRSATRNTVICSCVGGRRPKALMRASSSEKTKGLTR